jgi:hypothetical protein
MAGPHLLSGLMNAGHRSIRLGEPAAQHPDVEIRRSPASPLPTRDPRILAPSTWTTSAHLARLRKE